MSEAEKPVSEAVLAALLGVHLAEMEARLEAWGEALLKGATSGVVPAPPLVPSPGPAPALHLTPLSEEDLTHDWAGWSHHQAVRLKPGGEVELCQAEGTPGVSSAYRPAPGGALLCLRLTLGLNERAQGVQPVLRLINERGQSLGPDMPLPEGNSEHVFYVPMQAQRLRAQVLALRPGIGSGFTLGHFAWFQLDPESHQARLRHDLGAPVIASMASIPDRREMLRDAVTSLLAQCDRVRVFLNGYPDVPDFLRHPRVETRRSQDWDDKGDAGKFGWVEVLEAPGYRIIVDDDLIFAPHFARHMVEGARRYGDAAFVALHGVLLRQPLSTYYAPESRSTFHFGNPLGGTARCMCWAPMPSAPIATG